MTYSIDIAYLDYFKGAAEGVYDDKPIQDRLKATGMAAGTAVAGSFRFGFRVVNLVVEIAKVIFYSSACLFTLGKHGNAKRLGDHCKLLVLNTAVLAAQPLQVAIHTLAIVVGIASPKVAYRMMQGAWTPIAWITSHEKEIGNQYNTPKTYTKISSAIKTKITKVFDNCPWVMQLAMATIINEFSGAFASGLAAPLGFMDRFHSFGANPRTLTDEQKELTPIILFNGNYSHQATFLPLLHRLKLSNNKRPVYTINLPPNTVNPHFISSKVEAIRKQYGKLKEDSLEIDMVGHSMGSDLIQNICWSLNDLPGIQIGRAITIGSPFANKETADVAKKAFDIIAKNDLFLSDKSQLPETNQREIETGHLGLLFHHESLEVIEKFLME